MRSKLSAGCDLQELTGEWESKSLSTGVRGMSVTEEFGGAKAARTRLLSAERRLSCDWVIAFLELIFSQSSSPHLRFLLEFPP